AHVSEERARHAEVELAQAVAGVVPGDAPREARAEVAEAELAHEEGRELVGARGDALGPRVERLVPLEELRQAVDHRRARARGHDHALRVPVDVDEVARDRSRLVAEARVEGRLAAAGLPCVELDLAAGLLEHGHRRARDLRTQLVDETRDEERDAALHSSTTPLT